MLVKVTKIVVSPTAGYGPADWASLVAGQAMPAGKSLPVDYEFEGMLLAPVRLGQQTRRPPSQPQWHLESRTLLQFPRGGNHGGHGKFSGDPAPSAPDVAVTRQLREASKTVDIELIDHVIIGRRECRECDPLGLGFYSFRNAGLL